MKDVVGVIYTSKDEFSLRELASNRSVSALPVAGRYRLVDFMLSNLVNSSVRKVGVMMQGNFHSLMDHLGRGKEWNLHTRNNGLYLLIPNRTGDEGYQGILDAFKDNMEFLRRSGQEYVLIVGGRLIYNTTYDELMDLHRETGADISLMYTRFDPVNGEYSRYSDSVRAFINVDESKRVTDIEINPNVITCPNVLMDVLLIKRTLLMHMVDVAASHGYHDLYSHIIRNAVYDKTLKVVGLEFKGYCRRMETVNSFYNLNMDLLDPEVRRELFDTNPVYTKTRNDAPAKYLPGSKVSSALVADGCVIEGEVESSVLFRGVRVAKSARIKGCIIMQDCYIGEDVELENVILDKDVTVLSGARLIGSRRYPIVLGKNVTI
ncbi:MAG: glucose-1-phosphate adenylyltransferase subunit GlgD [Clostridia bacterium]|nr:glucose-1-phosphate adenylyltransferase subunit GlgD [Clostridia bacterium]MCR4578025.1 glucose-1-phosphate adenylyltransferase subunit GlgD [Clostridiales bacterium]